MRTNSEICPSISYDRIEIGLKFKRKYLFVNKNESVSMSTAYEYTNGKICIY